MWCLLPNPRQNTLMHELKMSTDSVVNWSSFCREVCIDWALQRRQKIGGMGEVVEIDESKFGKRKYNRGRRVEGQWVFGGIQRNNPKKFFLVPVETRDKETLLNLISEWILPGTTIISDCWKAYDTIEDQGFQHLKVNHSVEFVCTARSGDIFDQNQERLQGRDLQVHTNTIESRWRSIKYSIPMFGKKKNHFPGYFAEYMFKKNYSRETVVHHFFEAAAALYPPPEQ